jgi:Zn-finger nucleic acid-binding protein
MTCPSCGAPLRLESDHDCLSCEYCQSIYFPGKNDEGVRVFDDDAAESCPNCALPLKHAIFAHTRIRYCTRCRGILVPMEDFLELVWDLKAEHPGQQIPRPPDRGELNRHVDCPQCHRRMDTHFYGGPGNIVIDDCSRCYLNWLDHGELMRIAQAPDRAYP